MEASIDLIRISLLALVRYLRFQCANRPQNFSMRGCHTILFYTNKQGAPKIRIWKKAYCTTPSYTDLIPICYNIYGKDFCFMSVYIQASSNHRSNALRFSTISGLASRKIMVSSAYCNKGTVSPSLFTSNPFRSSLGVSTIQIDPLSYLNQTIKSGF